ncbi:hypothetical protein CspHIS471_0501330 [Cutaneotrichosporon sp. HIS471]|nr:hypothetical protein CspHIS471_0501330 [Cutaneotrichosporon sp. HIS471]
MFPHSSFTRGEATPRGLAGTRTPVAPRTPVQREESPTIADTAAPIAAVKAMDERPPTPDYKKAQYMNMSNMSSW